MTATRPLALVTGGSSGIGFELAARLAERGHDVAISGQSERVHDAAKEIEELGVEAYPFRADAATFDGVEAFWNHRSLSEPEKDARQGAMARPQR
ncbi:SDR family NAD(P)-dependent oxidoreductase [Actinomycetospora chibensis]|uniref:SDR family NAD(P)-dependent oxidoreductase n=1 Tax=Actinomycetospora chibensis TaxID=663606 RepID=A0ABV9RKM3_9PSEU|nr:SDR family NAD(P)-dependent oxidoreductase [Actinomycetospora chibensis]MDD7927812.1 SDR family NAD(P)-dependent oxidoreductase [Actinomycetospora chibensis]